MGTSDHLDRSNGYERVASRYIAGRGKEPGGLGAAEVEAWSRSLEPPAAILDLGCGPGVPISETLIRRGFAVYGVDASAAMVAVFRANFPQIPVECAALEESRFFDRTFDGVVAWGLLFLLDEEAQRQLIARAAEVLEPGGRLLFTAPRQIGSWRDAMTGERSVSLGFEEYRIALERNGLELVGTQQDAGDNFYYSAKKP